MSDGLFSVKMRASCKGAHISGAEKIVKTPQISKTVSQLVERALKHPKGVPDFVNLKIEETKSPLRLQALAVTTHKTKTAAEGRLKAAELLRSAGVVRIDEIIELFAQTGNMRGAMLLDADTLERLERDPSRGVRATYMDDADSVCKGTASGKNHYAEAIVLATKVQNAPGIIGEICVSDDPDYVTGYVATKEIGYCRITTMKERGDSFGGRVFLYRGPHDKVDETIDYLEKQAVIVENVPILPSASKATRFIGLESELQRIEEAGLSRVCRLLTSPTGPTTTMDNRELVVMSSNDYLDLARDERVIAAAKVAADDWGAGSGGSRLTTGTQPPHVDLEESLARFKGTEAALTWATGYMANLGVISALVGKGDVILSDALNHASIIDGARLSGADIIVYEHLNMDDLERKLASTVEYRRRLVVSDAVFSMDGDVLDLPRYLEFCKQYDAFSMIDEAHSTGVLGATGRGICEHFACGHADIMMGTLSKAIGSAGGYVCGSRLLIDYLRNKSRSFIFSTSPGAMAVASANAALAILQAEPERVATLQANIKFFIAELRKLGLSVSSDSAIVPIIIGDERKALRISRQIEEKGFLIPAIRYPTVAKGQSRLRVAIMSAHTKSQLSAAANAIAASVMNDAM